MIRLNLLAEESKQRVSNKRLYFLFLKTELILLLLVFVCGAILFATEKILSANVSKFDAETSQIIKISSSDYGSEAKTINNTLTTVSGIQGDFIPYSKLLKELSALAPEGVSFSYLKIDAKTKAIKIRGNAALRENILTLESNLKNAPFLTNVNIPLSDKLKKENIDFDIDLEFDLTKI